MTTSVYTVNSEADMRRVTAIGVDGIITNVPDVLQAFRPAPTQRPGVSGPAS